MGPERRNGSIDCFSAVRVPATFRPDGSGGRAIPRAPAVLANSVHEDRTPAGPRDHDLSISLGMFSDTDDSPYEKSWLEGRLQTYRRDE